MTASFDELQDHVESIEARFGTDPALMSAGQAEAYERYKRGAFRKAEEIRMLVEAHNARDDEDETKRARAQKLERLKEAYQNPANVQDGSFSMDAHATRTRNSNPWRDLGDNITRTETPDGLRTRAQDAIEAIRDVPHAGRELMASLVDQPHERGAAELVLAGTDPAYRTAFEKVIRNPVQGHLMWTAEEQLAFQRTESVRAALSLTGANGGFLVPFTLDPTIILNNAGAANPFRSISRIATTATNSWNGVGSAGVTAQWLAEAGVAADATPTFSQITITPQKAAAWVFGSYEAIGDTDISTQLPEILGDAKNNLENGAFSTGAGSGGVPKGIVTAATTAVTTASVATYAIADVYALQQALPARARLGKTPAVVGNVAIINKTRQFDTAGGSSYWTNLGEGAPAQVLGLRLAEASGMVSTTTTGSKILVAGDFDKYQIVDRLGMTVIFEPLLQDQVTGRPAGQGGWFAYWRVGADALDPTAFRVLTVQ
ncbi:phage major capsid protein [Diaminobutyricibacter tongyongensis]|uniref:Phage major capsid protein n=1 Tax=Leifsonia tongyongensis TaxID=1268043 RepID=A0A6L9XYJ8_9MICO|nr:phage major capsid protein [Diaminobutyricibacter tongyongensis]NEN06335.1 phage major capsid protein [Diaminobutyricibacter tongyongensis]